MEYELFSKHPEWPTVVFIVETLKKHGHQAVLAGGCVRDALLGKLAKDLDVATDATPDQIESYFPRVLPLGKSFGVCRVIQESESIEVATFRQESDYRDGRRPSVVEFSTLEKDAERRDFTINALFYDIGQRQVIDHVGGREDLKNKILRCVGNPDRRLSEDYLRILRGIRFLAQLELQVDPLTELAIKKHVEFLPRISRERIYDELNKMFVPYGMSRCWENLAYYNVLPVIFEGWDFSIPGKALGKSFHVGAILQQMSAAVKMESSLFGWIVLYHWRLQQQSVKSVEKEFMDFKIPRSTLNICSAVVSAEECISKSGEESLIAFIALMSSGFLEIAETYWDAFLNSDQFSITMSLFKKQYCVLEQLPAPLVTGHDLVKAGVSQGPEMKKTLQSLYLQQIQNPQRSKQELLDRVSTK